MQKKDLFPAQIISRNGIATNFVGTEKIFAPLSRQQAQTEIANSGSAMKNSPGVINFSRGCDKKFSENYLSLSEDYCLRSHSTEMKSSIFCIHTNPPSATLR